MKNNFLKIALMLFIASFFISFSILKPVEKLSLSMVVKSLEKGKSITAKGEVYYQTAGGLMVTHFYAPAEMISITNGFGEYKNYDLKTNSVMQMQGEEYSSKNSFFYFYLSGKTQDMGLAKFGYRLNETKIEDKIIVTTWLPPEEMAAKVGRAEMAHENYQPIFIAFFDVKGKPVQKTFYSNFQKVGDLSLPMSITEFMYTAKGDSTISKRVYGDIKINEQVETKYLTFKIPANAKVVK